MAAHVCHADGCQKVVPPAMLMCTRHWRLVPSDLKDAVWAHYVTGQEHRKNPTAAYMAAARAAIDAVATKEGRR